MKKSITYVALALLIITPAMVAGIPAVQASTSCYAFTTNHKVGSALTSAEAAALKSDLVTQGLWSSEVALTSYNATIAKAITTFQEKYSSDILAPNGMTSGNGFFGASTRSKMNSLYGCATTASAGTTASGASTVAAQCPTGYTCTPIAQTTTPVCPAGWTCTLATASQTPTTPDNSALLSQQINQLTSSNNSAYSDYYASNSNVVTIPATASTTTTYGLGQLSCADQGNCNTTGASTTVYRTGSSAVPLTTHTRGSGGGWDGTATSTYLAYTGCIARGDCAILVANALYPAQDTLATGDAVCPKGMAVATMRDGSIPTPGGSEPMLLCLHGGDPIPPASYALDPYCPNGYQTAYRDPSKPVADCVVGEANRNDPYINPWLTGSNILGIKNGNGSSGTMRSSTDPTMTTTNLCQNPVSLQYAATMKMMFANNPAYLNQLLSASTLYVHDISLQNFEVALGNVGSGASVNVDPYNQSSVIAAMKASSDKNCTSSACYSAGDGMFMRWVNANDWSNPTFQSLLSGKNIQIDGNSIVTGFTHLNGGNFAYLGRCLDPGYKSNFPAWSKYFTEALQRAKTAGLAQ